MSVPIVAKMATQDLKINRKLLWALILVFILGWMAVDMNRYVRRLPRMNNTLFSSSSPAAGFGKTTG